MTLGDGIPDSSMLALMTTLIHQMTQMKSMTTAEAEMAVAQALLIQIMME